MVPEAIGVTQRVVVVGAGGHAKVVVDILRLMKGHELIGLLDDNEATWGRLVLGAKVLGPVRLLEELRAEGVAAVVGVGDNEARVRLADYVRSVGVTLVNAIHPRAVIAPDVVLGTDVMIAAGAVVNPGTVLGDDVVVNTGATVDHDCILEKGAFVAPGCHLAGNVCVGEGAFLGTGAVAIPRVHIGRFATVGAGAVVRRNVPDDVLVVGNPARIIKRNDYGSGQP